MVQHSYAGLLEALISLSKGAAEIQTFKCPFQKSHRGQQTNHNT